MEFIRKHIPGVLVRSTADNGDWVHINSFLAYIKENHCVTDIYNSERTIQGIHCAVTMWGDARIQYIKTKTKNGFLSSMY